MSINFQSQRLRVDAILKLAVFTLCAWLSAKYGGKAWVVGPLFGATALVWQTGLKPPFTWRHFVFLVSSTLIYAAVHRIVGLWDFESSVVLLNLAINSLSIAVVFGSISLPAVQQWLFPETRKSFKKVVISLVLSYYALLGVSYVFENVLKITQFDFLSAMIVVWQGLYLCLFFWNGTKEKSV